MNFLDVLKDTIIDAVKILPFLLVAYLIMEYIEHKTTSKTKDIIKKSGKFGPLIGGILGVIPQCGFSVSATNFYAGRIITLGTLISVYLSTSDEMLPIMITGGVSGLLIFKILIIKIIIGVIIGFLIDIIFSKFKNTKKEENKIESICKNEHCHCEEGILKSAFKHTINIFIYIFVLSLILNILIEFIGTEKLEMIVSNKPILGALIAGLIGLIPNCASSVVLTECYLSGILNLGMMIGGLLINAGVGLLVLFRVNKNQKENIGIVFGLYFIGVIAGIILQEINI